MKYIEAEKLLEIFNKPYSYQVTVDNNHHFGAKFKTIEGLNVLAGGRIQGSTAGFSFEIEGRFSAYDYTGKRVVPEVPDAIRIFSTVLKIVERFLDTHLHIHVLNFEAYGNEPSKIKLYDRMVRTFVDPNEFDVSRHYVDRDVYYGLIRKS